MHGKIIRYISNNGKGVIMNASKMLFEFTKETWHDKKLLPMVGMFVEFRCNDKNQITDCKASKFQDFSKKNLVSESNFWHSQTDEELKSLQNDIRDSMIQKIYKNTNYEELQEVALSISVGDVIKQYFYQEFISISFLNDLSFDREQAFYDFSLCKRFVMKALDSFLYLDHSFGQDDFIEEISIITRLENSYYEFIRNQNINTKQIFQDIFLSQQCHFQALKATLENQADTLKLNERKLLGMQNELKSIENRLSQNNQDTQRLTERKAKLESSVANLASTIEKQTSQHQRLIKLYDYFLESYSELFDGTFQKVYGMLLKKIKIGLDICITLLDNKIYEKSIASKALKNSYFRHVENETCLFTMNFMEQYLDKLNKDRLNDNDKRLYLYTKRLEQKYRKYFLIVSTDEHLITEIKIKLLSESKFYSIKVASKEIAYFAMIRDLQFERIYLDRNTIWKPVDQLVSEAKNLKLNQNAKFLAIGSNETKLNRFGFEE